MKIVLVIFSLVSTSAVYGYSCPNYCNGRGQCLPEGLCECDNGWSGPSCSYAKCPIGSAWADYVSATDVAHHQVECSNRGSCDRTTGACLCDVGFEGQACERMTCNCNGHGQCMSMRLYAETKDPGVGSVYAYSENWDSDKIQGCVCDQGFTGATCLERICPTGDDSMTGTINDPNGVQLNEKQVVTCKATSGSFTLTYKGWTTEPIAVSDTKDQVKTKLKALPTINDVGVKFAGITTTACTSLGNDITIEFTQHFGNLPQLLEDQSELVHSSTTVVLTVATLQDGTKEDLPCSNRGLCDRTTGICACSMSFFSSDGNGNIGTRGDCGHATTTIAQCPGEIACSGHGICQGPPNYNCICNDGWDAGDCSEKKCPTGKSWFDLPIEDNTAHQLAECSNAGTCDRATGACVCRSGFTGAACNRLTCPKDCSGHGSCLTMQELAEETKVNGESTLWTYGKVPNKKETWDYDMVQGCHCNDGWEAHDCSKKSCPTGDDVLTVRDHSTAGFQFQMHEVQVITCTATTGTFALKFRDESTSPISFSATAADVKTALETLTTIGAVEITFSVGVSACTSDGSNAMFILFWDNFGDLPRLQATIDGITTFLIEADGEGQSIQGTKEEAVCSNRGLCDHFTGICRCFTGFTSSNGNGQAGDRGDCGFIEPFYLNSAGQVVNNIN